MDSNPHAEALEAGNQIFHEAYGGARDHVRQQVPILVLLPTELVLRRGETRHATAYCRASFARAKAAAHIAVALFALTEPESMPSKKGPNVAQLLEHLDATSATGPAPDATPLDLEIHALLQHCTDFARSAREQTPEAAVRSAFARDAGPRVLRITELATCEQVAGLHEAVEAMLKRLTKTELDELQVVVVGDHQARARSLGMQYFKRRLHEQEGTDRRVTYGENIEDEQEAIALVGTRRLDQRIAQAFFGDEHRLQRDVLGDAAKRCLDGMYFGE